MTGVRHRGSLAIRCSLHRAMGTHRHRDSLNDQLVRSLLEDERETERPMLLLGEEWIGKIGMAEPGTPHFDIMC